MEGDSSGQREDNSIIMPPDEDAVMTFEEVKEDYLDALDNLNDLVGQYNDRREDHPMLTHRHRVQTVPVKPWGSHVTKRYAPRKMQSLRDGPIETIKDQTGGSNINIQMVVNREPSFLDRLLGRGSSDDITEEITTLLDDINEAAKRVERVSHRVEELALQSEYHATEE